MQLQKLILLPTLIFLLFLSGCSTFNQPVIYPEYELSDVSIKVYTTDDIATVCGGKSILACALPSKNAVCIIFVKTGEKDVYVLGHELSHCLYGKWHG